MVLVSQRYPCINRAYNYLETPINVIENQKIDHPLVVIAPVDGIVVIAYSIIDVTKTISQPQIAKKVQAQSIFLS